MTEYAYDQTEYQEEIPRDQVTSETIRYAGDVLPPDFICQMEQLLQRISDSKLANAIRILFYALIFVINVLAHKLHAVLTKEAENAEIKALRETNESLATSCEDLRNLNANLSAQIQELQEKCKALQQKGEKLTELFLHLREMVDLLRTQLYGAHREKGSKLDGILEGEYESEGEDPLNAEAEVDPLVIFDDDNPDDFGGQSYEECLFIPTDKKDEEDEQDKTKEEGKDKEKKKPGKAAKDSKKAKGTGTKKAKKASATSDTTKDDDSQDEDDDEQRTRRSNKSSENDEGNGNGAKAQKKTKPKAPRTYKTRTEGDQQKVIENVDVHEWAVYVDLPDGSKYVMVLDGPPDEERIHIQLEDFFKEKGLEVDHIRLEESTYTVEHVEYVKAVHPIRVNYICKMPIAEACEDCEPEDLSPEDVAPTEEQQETSPVEEQDEDDAEHEVEEPEVTETEKTGNAKKHAGKGKAKKANGKSKKKGGSKKAEKARKKQRAEKRRSAKKYRTVHVSSKCGGSMFRNSHLTPSLLAKVIAMSFVLCVSMYRIIAYLWDMGLGVAQATVYNWMQMGAEVLTPLYEFLGREQRKEHHLHADESIAHVLNEEGRENKSISYLWLYVTLEWAEHQICIAKYHPGRSGEYAKEDLKGFVGKLITDAYQGYNAVLNVTRCLCMAHARRYFFLAAKCGVTPYRRKKAVQAVRLFDELFRREKAFRDDHLTPEQILAKRQEPEYRKLFDDIATISQEILARETLKNCALWRAATYFNNNKEGLGQFLTDGRVPLSNNRAERMVKPYALRRANCLLSGSPKGAMAAAICFSITQTAKLNGLNPQKYLKYCFERFSETPKEMHNDEEFLKSLAPWNEEVRKACGKTAPNKRAAKPEVFGKVA